MFRPGSFKVMNPQVFHRLGADMAQAGFAMSRSGRMRSLLERIRDEVIIPSIDTDFKVGGRPPWEPIYLSSWMNRETRGGKDSGSSWRETYIGKATSAKPLVDTGTLQKAATAKARFSIRGNEMSYGDFPSKRSWGLAHNFGANTGNGAWLPQREFVSFYRHTEDVNYIDEIALEWVEENINRNVKLYYV